MTKFLADWCEKIMVRITKLAESVNPFTDKINDKLESLLRDCATIGLFLLFVTFFGSIAALIVGGVWKFARWLLP